MGEKLSVELFVLIPQVTSWFSLGKIPENLPGRLLFLDQFLGIIDELDGAETFAEFLEYHDLHEEKFLGKVEMLASFASFKDSMGTLIEGAGELDMIGLDPHWGTSLRYKTLKDFWGIYPEKGYFDDPRAWNVSRETVTRTRLEARGYFGSAICCLIGSVDCFLTSPFKESSYEQGRTSNFLMECLEDTISSHANLVKNHFFFRKYNQINILIFPIVFLLDQTQ